MNRLIELTGWIVLVVSVILLGVASHIDNYQPPEQSAFGTTQVSSALVERHAARPVACFHLSDIKP